MSGAPDPLRTRLLLACASLLVLLGLFVTLTRFPDAWPDSQLYGSIARSRQMFGTGVPSVLRHSPVATDHVRFYGPVFFDLAAASFELFGVSRWSFRLVSFVGALALAAAGGLVARHLAGSWDRGLWAFTLLALTPEIGLHARSGSMDTVAVGLELLAMAAFVRGLATRSRPGLHGLVAGLLVAAAALTTPRTYPFIGAFLVSACLLLRPSVRRRDMAIQTGAAVAVAFTVFGLWATAVHGDPIQWWRFMAYIATHENTDVAVLPNATRDWAIGGSSLITPLFAVGGAIWAARQWRTERLVEATTRYDVQFALTTGWIALVTTMCLMNLTMTVGTYFALPLFAVVVSLPLVYFTGRPGVTRTPLLVCTVAVLLSSDALVNVKRFVSTAATWSARDPVPLSAWIGAHITPGADIVGASDRYFFVAEGAGARYSVVTTWSWADWARWVPEIDPEAVAPLPRIRPMRDRYLIWAADEDLPPQFLCAESRAVGVYTPAPPNALSQLGWIATIPNAGYPATVLYRLPADCPAGYDPTGFGPTFRAPQTS